MIGGGGNPWGALIGGMVGGAMGIEKHQESRAAYKQDKELAATTAKWAPWTGMSPTVPNRPSHVDNVGGGIIAGMQAGSGAPSGDYFKKEQAMPMGMRGTGRDGYPIDQDEAVATGRYDYVQPSGNSNPQQGDMMALTDEMQEDIDDEKKSDKQKTASKNNPWFGMETKRA